MPTYELSSTYFFRATGQKVEAGDTVELTEDQAAALNASHPGLLKPVRQTAQAHAGAVREPDEAKLRRTPGRRPRARR